LSSLRFGGCLFSSEVLFEPLVFLGLPLFSLEVFILSPLHFGGCLFSSEVFVLSQRMKVAIMRLHSWLWLTCITVLSNTVLELLAILMIVMNILGNEAYITASGLHELPPC
jgi:hypothetical protein